MRPMFLLESGESSGGVSLRSLFDGGPVTIARSRLTLGGVAFLTCRGGWPKAVSQPKELALQQAPDYVDAVVESDISRVDGVRRDPERVCMLMRSYARMTASQGSYEMMLRDVAKSGLSFGRTSFLEYVAALKRLFVTDDLGGVEPQPLRQGGHPHLPDTALRGSIHSHGGARCRPRGPDGRLEHVRPRIREPVRKLSIGMRRKNLRRIYVGSVV